MTAQSSPALFVPVALHSCPICKRTGLTAEDMATSASTDRLAREIYGMNICDRIECADVLYITRDIPKRKKWPPEGRVVCSTCNGGGMGREEYHYVRQEVLKCICDGCNGAGSVLQERML